MKKLGLIGGTGPESTLVYYKELTSLVKEKSGRDFFPNLTIESLSVFDVLRFCEREEYDALCDYLLHGIQNLSRAGCDFTALTGITPHIVLDELQSRSPIPIVSMIDVSVSEAADRGISRIALLGTRPTMSGTFFRKPFEQKGISVSIPTEEEQSLIAQKIETELENGIVTDATREALSRIIRRLQAEQGAQAVVLGCTELPLLYAQHTPPLPVIDPMRLHIQALAGRMV